MSRWFNALIHHDYGRDPRRFDPVFGRKLVGGLEHLYGPGRYFDLSMRGLEHVPNEPSMLICNHSGGTTSPDVWALGVAWYQRFGFERPLYFLCHELLFALPRFARFFEKCGALRASMEIASEVLAMGRDVVIYPGGDRDVWRPYSERYRVDFRGRSGFARLAIERRVPIVPIAHAGSHETLRVLTSGHALAKAVGLHQVARADIWPIHLSLPWGLALGPVPHLPLPAKFRFLAGAPLRPGGRDARTLALDGQRAIQRQLDVLADEASPHHEVTSPTHH
ncbi:MAG: 1-acyl-sn-glycerol-3-phosphate acyltransferase [Archangiaceae bacterium]|nr:1-acyl-sn-glycerol-3-phosphate acyltransferase [Archangiaceae bacterium]